MKIKLSFKGTDVRKQEGSIRRGLDRVRWRPIHLWGETLLMFSDENWDCGMQSFTMICGLLWCSLWGFIQNEYSAISSQIFSLKRKLGKVQKMPSFGRGLTLFFQRYLHSNLAYKWRVTTVNYSRLHKVFGNSAFMPNSKQQAASAATSENVIQAVDSFNRQQEFF